MNFVKTLIVTTTLITVGWAPFSPVMASQHGKHEMSMMHGKGHGMHHDGGWKSTLSEKQVKQLAKLKLSYKKKVYPIKANIKQAKIELALLMTAEQPNQKEIDKQINAIVKLKAEKIRLKTGHKIEVRKMLNEEQRVMFDMKVLKKAYYGKKRYRRGHH